MILCTLAHFLMHIWRRLLRQFCCCIFGAFSTPARKAEHSLYVCSVSVRLFSPPASPIGRASSARPGANMCDAHSALTQGNVLQRRGVCCTHLGGRRLEMSPGTHGRRWGATTCLPPHDMHTTTAYTRQDATHTRTCRPRDGAARIASAILLTHLFCLRRLRLFMFNTSVITLPLRICFEHDYG